ncbi:MAG: glycosyltransferase family 2 protein [Gammaproteobacteria bacterium]|nr:MAG: glycosyltransferase family 2 protein [Gammaproteobacteria bacterium]
MTKIAAVSMVKNECDIIEWFIKLNARFVDHFFIIDHLSSDDTRSIIERLRSEGYAITCLSLEQLAFDQSAVMTRQIREVAIANQFDYIIPLDADEFVDFTERSSFNDYLKSKISPVQLGVMEWLTFCPVADDFYNSDNPLYEIFFPREFEPAYFTKVILGNEFAKQCVIATGNHSAKNKRYKNAKVKLDIKLHHVPVRSSQQVVRKVLLGDYSSRLNVKRKKGDGYHWTDMACEIRANNYQLSPQKLLDFALQYSVPKDKQVPLGLNKDGPRIGVAGMSVKVTDESRINLVRAFDMYTASLVEEQIRRNRGFFQSVKRYFGFSS